MILYLDTSVVVSALSNEPASAATRTWLDRRQDTLAISEWVAAEFSSAISLKLRTRQINLDDRALALVAFARFRTDTLTILPISVEVFRAAAHMASQHELALRAADALHVAACQVHGAGLATLDRRLAAAARALGVETETPDPH